jgi:hypothetical protein
MLALLLAVALIGLTVLALLLAGVLVAVLTAIAVLNLCLLAVGLRVGRPSDEAPIAPMPAVGPERLAERWRPAAFRLPPEPPVESEHAPPMRIHRG